MKFLVDAQLPRRLATLLRDRGHDAVHTLDLPKGNTTTDREINAISLREERVVVTKDSDFVDSLILHRLPWKLLAITTGNLRNAKLESLLLASLEKLLEGLEEHDHVELSTSSIVFHE